MTYFEHVQTGVECVMRASKRGAHTCYYNAHIGLMQVIKGLVWDLGGAKALRCKTIGRVCVSYERA